MKRVLLYAAVLLAVAMPLSAGAEVFDVTTPAEFQTRLTQAQNNGENDTINVAAGTYDVTSTLEYLPTEKHSLTIVGAGAGQTILNGVGSVRILLISNNNLAPDDSNAHIAISGITVQKGIVGDGAGLYTRTLQADITVQDSEFKECSAPGWGGGAYAHSNTGTITFADNVFSDNNAQGGSEGGGGLYARSVMGAVTLTNNTFSGNQADMYGGGAYARSDDVTVTLTANTFTGNSALGGAGANVSNSETGILTGNTFNKNSASSVGGGARLSCNTASLTGNSFIDNSADEGGGIRVYQGTLTLTNNIFSSNSGNEGGAAYFYRPIITLTNNTFSDNSAADIGGGVYIFSFDDTEEVNIYNNIIWGNTALNNGADLYIADDGDGNFIGAEVNLHNNDYSVLAYDDGDNLHHGDNINQDPLLTADFHLQAGSPCIDAGENGAPGIPSTDFEGDSRTIDGNGDGSSVADMGADEYDPGPPPAPAGGGGGCFIATAAR
ncbi:MAG: right-handed parallel beta-helix repeat-containing protein [Planctomycetes bacterium]|nr:right-handed parallel beta-helix repeat-containing protein [Planctomycetota bacterium]